MLFLKIDIKASIFKKKFLTLSYDNNTPKKAFQNSTSLAEICSNLISVFLLSSALLHVINSSVFIEM